MRCEEFEESVSDYLDGLLEGRREICFETHLHRCPVCCATLRGVAQVRQALGQLGHRPPSARFQMQLSSCLQEELIRRRSAWVRPLAWGVAVAAALMILLWPQADYGRAEFARQDVQDGLASEMGSERRLDRFWHERFPELSRPAPSFHAHARAVSF